MKEFSSDERAAAQRQLDRIIESSSFAQASRLQRFLTYVVEETLAGRGSRLNQYDIALSVFDRDESFDPAIDAIVRVEAGRLRTKIRDYYIDVGTDDAVIIELNKGSYAASFVFRPQECAPVTVASGTRETDLPTRIKPLLAPRPESPVIAILPFVNMSPDRDHDYLADGLSEDLITDLSQVPGLSVIARQSTFVYKDARVGAREICNDLGADYVVEGSVRKNGVRMRINAQLIEGNSGTHIWAERFDCLFDDIFEVQDKVNRNIVEGLRLGLNTRSHPPTRQIEAYDYVLIGMKEARAFTRENSAQAQYCFRRAIELDPQYAAAHARLAFSYIYQWIVGWSDSHEESAHKGLECARCGVAIDHSLALGQAALCWGLLWTGQHDEAIRAGQLAVKLSPSDVDSIERLSLTHSWAGEPTQALALIEAAKKLNPQQPYYFPTGVAYFMSGDYETAINAFRDSLDSNHSFLPALLYLGSSYGLVKQLKEATVIVDRIRQVSPRYSLSDERYVFKHREDCKRFAEGLLAVGLTKP